MNHRHADGTTHDHPRGPAHGIKTPAVPVPVSYRDAHTIALALEARARWMEEGSGDEGPRLAAVAYFLDLAERFNRAAIELLDTFPIDQVRAEMRADERSTTV